MVEVTPYKSVTLGGLIKEAQAKGKNPAAYLQEKASVAEDAQRAGFRQRHRG